MNLIEQLIHKKLELFEEKSSKNEYEFWSFYQAVSLGLAGLGESLNLNGIRLRNRMYQNMLNDEDAEKSFIFFSNILPIDRRVISKYLAMAEIDQVAKQYEVKIYKPGMWAVLQYEVENA
jgi:hypothetical protein